MARIAEVRPGCAGVRSARRATLAAPAPPGLAATLLARGRAAGAWSAKGGPRPGAKGREGCARPGPAPRRPGLHASRGARYLPSPTMVTLPDVKAALGRIRDRIYLSPCARSETLSRLSGADAFLKLENLQMTGAYKERGALNKLLLLSAGGAGPRADRRQRRQPRAGRRLPRRPAGRGHHHRHARDHPDHEGGQHPGPRRAHRAARRQLRRGLRRGPPAGAGRGAHLRPPLRRPAGHRRAGDHRPGAARAGARPRRRGGAGGRRRAHLRRGGGAQGAAARRSGSSASRPSSSPA